jgi:3-oxoacyl-[acyl-carrier-protein] synthase III
MRRTVDPAIRDVAAGLAERWQRGWETHQDPALHAVREAAQATGMKRDCLDLLRPSPAIRRRR